MADDLHRAYNRTDTAPGAEVLVNKNGGHELSRPFRIIPSGSC